MFPVERFNEFALNNNLFTPQSKILVAVSGGMDSVYLATILHIAGYNFGIAHCNFLLRGNESDGDEAFCKAIAQKFNVPIFTKSFNTSRYAAEHKISTQMAARNLRYQWFEELRQQHGYDVIAVAHHQNDTVETILLNLTRGTGVAGMGGIKPKNGLIIRPLLFLTHAEIAKSVSQNKISYREDSSNAATKYARNKIRHEVIPRLKELNPRLENTFAAHQQHFAELAQLFEMQLARVKEKIFIHYKDEILLPVEKVKKLNPQHLLLHGLLKPYGFSATTVTDIISVLDKHAGRTFTGDGHKLILDRGNLAIAPLEGIVATEQQILAGDADVTFGNYGITITTADTGREPVKNPAIAIVEAEKLIFPLTLRNWHPGDSFKPLGMQTRKKLSDFFVSLKIPLHKKDKIPLLVNGNGDIIWVCGYRIDDRYKITPATKKIYIFELTELNDR